jgi:hypothetical protein
MGFTGILVVTVLAIMILAIYVILQEIKARNWKKLFLQLWLLSSLFWLYGMD